MIRERVLLILQVGTNYLLLMFKSYWKVWDQVFTDRFSFGERISPYKESDTHDRTAFCLPYGI